MTAKFHGKWDIIALVVAVALIVVGMLLASCGHSREAAPAAPAVAPIGKTAPVDAPAKTSKEADTREGEALAQVSFWKAKAEVEHEAGVRLREQERRAWLESACRVIMGLCWAGIFANGALFAASFVWPWFERLRYVALAGIGIALVLLVIAWNLPAYIGAAGVAVALAIAGSVVAFLVHAHRDGRLGHEARSIVAKVREMAP